MRIDQNTSERLSVLRFPLIVGVVFIHADGTEIGLANGVIGVIDSSYLSDFIRNLISQGISRIAVPLFFLMSGYFFFLGFSWSIKNYMKKIQARVKTLLVPFLFWNIFTLSLLALAQDIPAIQVYLSGKKDLISTFGTYQYLNAIFGIDRSPISYQFWFIRDLMVIILLTPAIYLIIRRIPKIFLAGIFLLWFFDIWLIYVPSVAAIAFFYAGAYFACSNISLFALDRFGSAIISSYSAVLLIDTFSKGYEFNNYIHRTGVLLGVASALYISKAIVRMDKAKIALLWAGGCSFFVFAMHEPLLTIVKKITYDIVLPNSDLNIVSLYLAIPVLIIFTSILLYVAMKSVSPRFLSMVSGGR